MSLKTSDKIRLLIAGECPILLQGAALVLNEEEDIEVVGEVNTGLELIRCVNSLLPDVVLIDHPMATLSCLDAEQTFDDGKGPSVIVLSANNREDALLRAFEAGAKGYLLKMEPVETIVNAIRIVCRGEEFISPLITSQFASNYIARIHQRVAEDAYQKLSTREQEVFPYVAHGDRDHEIALRFNISPYTIATYRKRIMRKLSLHSKVEIFSYALQRGIITV